MSGWDVIIARNAQNRFFLRNFKLQELNGSTGMAHSWFFTFNLTGAPLPTFSSLTWVHTWCSYLSHHLLPSLDLFVYYPYHSLWRKEGQPTPVFLPGEFHGQRSLAEGRKESGMTKWLSMHTHILQTSINNKIDNRNGDWKDVLPPLGVHNRIERKEVLRVCD